MKSAATLIPRLFCQRSDVDAGNKENGYLKKKKSKQWKLNPVSFNKENKCEVRGDRIEEKKEETVFY